MSRHEFKYDRKFVRRLLKSRMKRPGAYLNQRLKRGPRQEILSRIIFCEVEKMDPSKMVLVEWDS